jgi:hypothetical protein
MAHIAANLIAHARSQFSDTAHASLSAAHGHHFEVHRPKVAPRQAPTRRPLAAMADDPAPVDTEQLLAQKQQKITAHNARITALNNSNQKGTNAPLSDAGPRQRD